MSGGAIAREGAALQTGCWSLGLDSSRVYPMPRQETHCPVSLKAANVRLRLRVILRRSELPCESLPGIGWLMPKNGRHDGGAERSAWPGRGGVGRVPGRVHQPGRYA